MEVCGPESDPMWLKLMSAGPSALSLVVSIAALIVAVRTYTYTSTKDQKARAQSIQDDFWLRTVVSPASIEPFLKFIGDLRAALPHASATTPLTPNDLTVYWGGAQRKFNEFSMSFQSLALIDLALQKSVEQALLDLEDGLSDYVAALGKFVDGTVTVAPNRADAAASLTRGMLRVFQLVQDHQRVLG